MLTDVDAQTVVVAGAEFGWGSSGKLGAILSALRKRSPWPLRFVGLASGLGRPVLSEHGIDRWYDLPNTDDDDLPGAVAAITRSERAGAAVVVLDGVVAKALEASGVPTVFVDSLPFMWSRGDLAALPLDATVYCAQKCVELPPECLDVLASVRTLRWVEAVVGTPPVAARGATATTTAEAARPYRTALVTLGGLRSPSLADWTSYPRIVVPAVLEALAAFGIHEAHVAGNLPADLAGQLVDASITPPRVTTGALSHGEFLDRVAGCDVLLTSPGLTTLLEAGDLRVPTICLPPQNLSQIFNGRFHTHAIGAPTRVTWPKGVFTEEEALSLRSRGEDHALALIYAGIATAAADADGRATGVALRDDILTALRRAAEGGIDWGALTATLGVDGAAQVADSLLAILPSTRPAA
ncbi:hydroxymethylcytosylglucuronate/cytosylglucuronate synthase [Streptomyces sp. SID3343]|uniref:hydroxymethylcytosylglucuronate/cytosylglucurona te synthase n=1 Tax=Streptomyces sp. SID3343 TaxID=2690260 RepID=UPI001369CFF4|nr:hydroxymethylcytosylglucuronate/cytosylglucuronate synthase [Streptomyces sp. SID3343]MYW05529.1 hydroxymethylcytosylglucuronate/cytosylglucuronate synthase [Streptomyces sp. SID3343]